MIRGYGIDTYILVRPLTRDPQPEFGWRVAKLTSLVYERSNESFASNQVIGETCVAVHHLYGVSRDDARSALLMLLQNPGWCVR